MSDSPKAVFLSYASEDAGAARGICEALRAAGIEVWFDQSELVGGDAWDAKIRKHIKECTLLIPIISAATQARTEGYFRLEWRLADQRTHLMAKGRPFLLPVVIDDTRDAEAHVPDSFTEVQWTRLRGGETPPAFVARVRKLLSGEEGARVSRPVGSEITGRETRATQERKPVWLWVVLAVVASVLAYLIFKPRRSPEEIAKLIANVQTLAANADRTSTATPANNSDSRPEVTNLLARVHAVGLKTDVFRTELDTATGLLEQAARMDPNNAALWAEWALIDWRYGIEYFDRSPARFDAARRHVAQAVSLDPNRPTTRLAQALVMTLLSDDAATQAAAAKILESLLPEMPGEGRVPLELGWHTFDRNHPEVALAWFDRTARIPGEAGRAHFGRSITFMMMGSLDKTEAELDLALAAERAPSFLLWKAYILTIWNGDVAAAKQVLAEIPPQIWVEDMPAMTRYFVELNDRDYDQALAAIRAVPHDYIESVAFAGPAGYFKGDALARAGKPAAAQLEWRSALAVVERRLATEPNDQTLMQFKVLLLACLGDKAGAEQVWKAELELYGDKGGYGMEQYLRMKLLPADQAFDWVAQKVANSLPIATAARLRLDPVYDPVRADPRFPALLAQAEADPRLSPTAKAKPVATVPAAVDEKSVAVLAFANLSEDKANEYFSDGISEELLNVLAKVPGLKVSARTSAFYFKNKDVPVGEIARQLGVAYVVEGSVRKAGDKVRITAELVKASDGFQVWSDTFTRDLKDIFAVQDEIAGLVAKNLQLKLDTSVRVTATVDPEAYRLYLQGRQALVRRTEEGFDQAEKLFNKARAIVPEWAPLYAALADAGRLRLATAQAFGPDAVWSAELKNCLALAKQALVLDPNLPEGYVALGGVYMEGGNLPEAERLIHRALELNPNLADAYLVLGRVQSALGRMDEALAAFQRAAELNPLAPRILDNQACQLDWAGRYEEGWNVIERATALQPDSVQIQCYRARLLTSLGRRDEALQQARELEHNSTDPTEWNFRALTAAEVYARFGHLAEAEALAARLAPGVSEKVISYGCIRRPEAALPLLGQLNFFWLDDLIWNPDFDAVRQDPRYRAYLEKAGLVEANARAQAWRKAHPAAKS